MEQIKTLTNAAGVEEHYRDGIRLHKGFTLNEEWINRNLAGIKATCQFWTAYPDYFIKLITPVDSHFELYFYQKIFLRACLRYRYHYCCAPRAFSKTFLSMIAMYLRCMFYPGSKVFICAPGKSQGAKVAKEKIEEILDMFPILRKELVGETYTSGADYLRMVFRNNSVFDVVAPLGTTRGGRRHSGIIDEVRDHDGTDLNEIVLPWDFKKGASNSDIRMKLAVNL